jgi:hypothetical protein
MQEKIAIKLIRIKLVEKKLRTIKSRKKTFQKSSQIKQISLKK